MIDYNNLKWHGALSLFSISVLHSIGVLFFFSIYISGSNFIQQDLNFSWHYLDLLIPLLFLFSIRNGKELAERIVYQKIHAYFSSIISILKIVMYANVITAVIMMIYMRLEEMGTDGFYNDFSSLLSLGISYTFAIMVLTIALGLIPSLLTGGVLSLYLKQFRIRV